MGEKQYATPLRVVTPHMHGREVTDAQWLMAGHSRFEGLATMKDADIDGIYGLVSGIATARTKWWLGYPEGSCTQVFGQTLYEYLRPHEWRPLPEAYRERRAIRLKAAAKTPGGKALDLLIQNIGYKETYKNRTKFGEWYGWNGVAWCAIAESYCLAHTGWTRFHYASCLMIYLDARAGRNGLRQVWTPRRGDVVIWTVRGDRYGHTSFFEKDLGGGMIGEVGGNTGPSSFNNGGMVARGQRSKSTVTAYIRVG